MLDISREQYDKVENKDRMRSFKYICQHLDKN